MLNQYHFEGKDKTELLKRCLNELNVEQGDLFIAERETEKGLFKAKKYYFDVIKKSDLTQYIRDFLKQLCNHLKMEVNFEIRYVNGTVQIKLQTSNNALLIGKSGKNLEALETILNQAIKEQTNLFLKVRLDISDYRANQELLFENEIKKVIHEVLVSKIDTKLDPMNSYQRRMIHQIVSQYENLRTESIGIEPNRYVIIHYEKN